MDSAEHFLSQCLVNGLRQIRVLSKIEPALFRALSLEGSLLGLDIPVEWDEADDAKLSRADWLEIRKKLESKLGSSPITTDETHRLIEGLIALFGIDDADAQVFRLVSWASQSSQFEQIYDALGMSGLLIRRFLNLPLIAALLGLTDSKLRNAIHPKSALFLTGLLVMDDDGDISMGSNVLRVLNVERPSLTSLDASLIGDSLTTELQAKDYKHLGDDWHYLAHLLDGAIQSRAAGVNILLHGAPGTGKTELCKALAAAVGYPIYPAGRTDKSGREPSRLDRISGLRGLQNLLGRRGKGMILVDEAQDIFRDDLDIFQRRHRNEGSRVFMHEFLETMPVPVLWTANAISGFGGPVLRRMSYVLELKTPPIKVRTGIWKQNLTRSGIRHTARDAKALALDYPLAPAVTAAAIRSASLARGTVSDVRRAAESLARALGQSPIGSASSAIPFDGGLATADIDLVALSEKLSGRKGATRFSMCLYGPPGTGKSAYARALAETLELEVIQKRYSDLASKYIGETEKAIADAFSEAAATGAMLVFDEADSLLADRSGAERSWEVTQVNEMLTWMEKHPLPFVCTTNLMDRLDPASLHRFTFKVKMGFLSEKQLSYGFRRFFGIDAPAGIARLSRLTPGDLALVHQKAAVLGCLDAPDELLRLLEAEEMSKPGLHRPIGFSAT